MDNIELVGLLNKLLQLKAEQVATEISASCSGSRSSKNKARKALKTYQEKYLELEEQLLSL